LKAAGVGVGLTGLGVGLGRDPLSDPHAAIAASVSATEIVRVERVPFRTCCSFVSSWPRRRF
jgi:hypothetical protein